MKHLSMDEMINYVSLNDFTSENLEFIAEKNIHLAECKECSDRVMALQVVYDELATLGINELSLIKEEFEKRLLNKEGEDVSL